MLHPPKFWQKPSSWQSIVLQPLSWVYKGATRLRKTFTSSQKVSVPVICVGNLVLGGAGKTLTVATLAKILKKMGETPHILSRGYGGYEKGPLRVDPLIHTFNQVGDEPLLLAESAITWVCKDRFEGANCAIKEGATILILDDGFQNPTLAKDINFVVVDTAQGIGNGKVFPAGPLRESIKEGIKRTHALVIVGDKVPEAFSGFAIPYFHAFLDPPTKVIPEPVVAFAGIGYPKKFQQSLETLGFEIRDFIAFTDHHPYTANDVKRLKHYARIHQAPLITTAKDFVRLPVDMKPQVKVLPITLEFLQPQGVQQFLKSCL